MSYNSSPLLNEFRNGMKVDVNDDATIKQVAGIQIEKARVGQLIEVLSKNGFGNHHIVNTGTDIVTVKVTVAVTKVEQLQLLVYNFKRGK